MRQHIPMDSLRKIDTELNRLKSIQGDPFAEEPKFNRVEKSQQFMQWCTQHGIYYNGFEIREDVQGLGLSLFITKTLYPQDVTMKIPKQTVITYASTVAEIGHIIPDEFKEDDQVGINMYCILASVVNNFCSVLCLQKFLSNVV